MTLTVTRVTTPEELATAKAIRFEVFINEQGNDGSLEVDEHDAAETTWHFIGKDVEHDKYVAAARVLLTVNQRKAQVGRVVVLKECRGKHYGAMLMKAVEDAVADQVDTYVLSSQYERCGFYEKCGYKRLNDEVYLDQDIVHCMMIKTGFDPTLDIDDYDQAETTRHFLSKDTDLDEYVAVARCLLTPELRKAKIGRVAVLPKCRGKGYGIALIKAIKDVVAHEADTYMLSAIYERQAFYQKCVYERLDDESYIEQGVPHCMMVKQRIAHP
ncbi:hypothetical protein Poli38472_005856 [Pythium oligandrum]|uniref:N-acetyltransferase domain-containing protein n=1 Tax=Pythium oligandrum TaxID=41045 RepID=A0A8K1CT06_PYTOL|nr:hypothetical protein Poli38472_005856 [Pythium oligandrum]|eukprot:TMW68388.1 hypothetical protein Poli38472_005856 [Pythium oligandrum]